MATAADDVRTTDRRRPIRFAPDTYEKILAVAASALLVVVIVALAKGFAYWHQLPRGVWLHLATVVVALALTPFMLLRPRGDRLHRRLGKVWVASMFLTALISFFVQTSHPGHFSFIHILSAYVLVAAPAIWWTAATHRVRAHRRQVRGMVTGALVIAGYFTLLPVRALGTFLFS